MARLPTMGSVPAGLRTTRPTRQDLLPPCPCMHHPALPWPCPRLCDSGPTQGSRAPGQEALGHLVGHGSTPVEQQPPPFNVQALEYADLLAEIAPGDLHASCIQALCAHWQEDWAQAATLAQQVWASCTPTSQFLDHGELCWLFRGFFCGVHASRSLDTVTWLSVTMTYPHVSFWVCSLVVVVSDCVCQSTCAYMPTYACIGTCVPSPGPLQSKF